MREREGTQTGGGGGGGGGSSEDHCDNVPLYSRHVSYNYSPREDTGTEHW